MGAWSTALLGNDTAMDLVDRIADGGFDFAEVEHGLAGEYIDHEAGVMVLVLVELSLVARGLREAPTVTLFNGESSDMAPLPLDRFAEFVSDERSDWLVTHAERVVGVGSEEFELWQESGGEAFNEWMSNATATIGDLRRALAPTGDQLF